MSDEQESKPKPPAPLVALKSVTFNPVFGDSQVINAVLTGPGTIYVALDGTPWASATTTVLDEQASFTVSQKADGTFPVATVTSGP